MNFIVIGMLIMQAARLACGTCVLESDFGFILNCNFKKSGLFRVRNLGGLKAHFGLGFSLGDELGFAESLGNVEGGRRRSIGYKNGPPPNAIGVLPGNQQINQQSLTDKRIISRSPLVLSPELRESLTKQAKAAAAADMLARQNAIAEMAAKKAAMTDLAARQAALAQLQAQKANQGPLMTEARPLPLGVPVFRPIPNKQLPLQTAQRRTTNIAVDTPNSKMSINNRVVDMYNQQILTNRTFHAHNPIVSQPIAVPAFQAMPDSVNKITAVLKPSPAPALAPAVLPVPVEQYSIPTNNHPNYLQFEEPKFDLKDISVDELARAANVSVDTIKHAIYVREQQMRAEQRAMLAAKLREEFMRTSTSTTTTTSTTSTTTTSTTTTTPRPFVQYIDTTNTLSGTKMSKVMNAPKEYYPVGYDKNFDDNFKSKVDLPPTTFSCAKQKHFPGLYADTDLGCMVFHVCALTDDGMVRKSFLCPENTLFDQTILKCNWWFYVDCAASKSVYDSNIPISKSYQLMKSLTYFSKFNHQNKNSEGDYKDGGLDIQTLKESMDNVDRNSNAEEAADLATAAASSTKHNHVAEDEHQQLNES